MLCKQVAYIVGSTALFPGHKSKDSAKDKSRSEEPVQCTAHTTHACRLSLSHGSNLKNSIDCTCKL